MHDIKAFFKSINFTSINQDLEEMTIDKVVLNKKEEVFNVYLHSKKVLPIKEIDALLEASKNKINGEYKCNIMINYDEVTFIFIVKKFYLLQI